MRSLLLLCPAALLLGACSSPHEPSVPDAFPSPASSPRQEPAPTVSSTGGSAERRVDSSARPLESFAATLADSLAESGSAGFLPLVTYRAEGRAPEFSDLGEDIADQAAALLAEASYPGRIYDTASMRFRVRRANLERDEIVSMEALGTRGLRLGLDAVITGTIRENRRPGTPRSLSVDLIATSLRDGATLARERFEVQGSDVTDGDLWTLFERRSLWDKGAWSTPTVERTLAAELDWAATALVGDLEPALKAARGRVAVAPVETGGLIAIVSHLRAVQRDWAAIESRLAAGGLSVDGSVELDGRVFADASLARSYVARLHDDVGTAPALAFARTITSQIEAKVRAAGVNAVSTRGLDLDPWTDPSFVRASASSARAGAGLLTRNAFEENGVDVVLIPVLSGVGGTAMIRLEAYEVGAGTLIGSSHWPLQPEESRELLGPGSEAMRSWDDTRQARMEQGRDWTELLARVQSGIVRIDTPLPDGVGQGTGFVVADSGLVITNAHVVDRASGQVRAEFPGGETVNAEVVEVDGFWDVAVLKLASLPGGAHVFAFEEEARIGAEVALMGHPQQTSGWVLSTGFVSSTDESARTTGDRPSLMYTCATRSGSSGSPVFDRNGRVIAVHSHGMRGVVQGSGAAGVELRSEMPGFALGAPASKVLPILRRVAAAY